MSGSESVKSCLCSKPAELQPSSSPPPVSTSLPLFLAHKASLSINGTNVLTRWLCLGLDRAPPFVFLTAGHQQHHRSHSIFSGHLSASRYFANSPLRPRHPLLRTTLSFCAIFIFGRNGHLALLRLAGDLRRHRRRDHLRWVRSSIANPSLSLSRAAVAGAAGKELGKTFGFLSDDVVLCRAQSRQRSGSYCANQLLNLVNDCSII